MVRLALNLPIIIPKAMASEPNKAKSMSVANFMALADDLAYAKTFYPGSDTEHYLNHLISGYQSDINKGRPEKKTGFLSFWMKDFPLLIAQEYKTLLFAFFFFLLSVGIGVFSARGDAAFVRLVLGDSYVNHTLDNIAKGTPMGVYNSSKELDMFVQITTNNIKVSFNAFVFGLFFSIGTLWILFLNGLMVGAFQYFFYQHNLLLHSSLSIWAHGTFEMTAIVIAAGAGLVMGNSFLFPGTYTRLHSFRRGALSGIKLVTGLIPFFILAGWIESFITRYADSRPLLGGVCVALSIIGVVAYFIIYPVFLYRKIHKHDVDVKD